MIPAKKESARLFEESKEHPVSSNRTGPIPPVYPLHIRALGSTVSKTSSEAQCSPSSTKNQRSNQHQTPCTRYSPSSMTKSSNKGQTVGEKYSGIEFLQTPGRTPASGSPLEGIPVPRIPARRNPGSPLWSFPGQAEGEVPGTGPGELYSGEPGFLLAGTQRSVSCLGSGGIQYLSIFPQQKDALRL
ncbi:hypothetical protein DY000_02014925 [Brassica cretica]|uniref:DUF4005 domain-containing protein n=1 Tax=Brassica cretica TaxID=69181 RepID=A0ABQ7CWG5_BRACR|nr:hypothetical protein DY000_02014925 [Brassica cretica]